MTDPLANNPFVIAAQQSEPSASAITSNPFLTKPSLTPAPPARPLAKPLPPCGDASCSSSHRPDGSHYSSDRRERALQLKEDGKMGPQFGSLGGARAKERKRVTEVIAESAAEHAEQIQQVFIDGIDPSQPIGVRLKAAKEMVGIASEYDALMLKARQAEFDAMSRAELAESISEMLDRIGSASQLVQDVSGDVIDVEPLGDSADA